MTVPDRNTFESAYAGQAPWDIGRPQKAFLDVADRITGSVLDAGCGTGENALGFKHAASREVSWERVIASQPEYIVIAECGFDVARQRQDIKVFWERIRSVEHSFAKMPELWICDGSQYFSRPGPRPQSVR